MDDPYKLLGVARDATQDQIKSAYRKLARKLHPDLNPGNKQAEEKFKKVSGANDLLSDPAQRARFDAGEIDANGAERPRANTGAWSTGGRGGGEGFPFGEDASDFLSEMLRRRAQGGARRGPTYGDFEDAIRGADAHYVLRVNLPEAALGTTKRIGLANGKSLDVKVPAGTEEGAVLRLKGQGATGIGGGPAGDALIEIRIEPHPLFTKHGDDIAMTLPVTLAEAALGAKVTAPTLDGRVTLSIPPGSNTGTVLRLKGKGVAKGRARSDLLVTLEVKLPDTIDPELEAFLKKWSASNPYPVRGKIDGAS